MADSTAHESEADYEEEWQRLNDGPPPDQHDPDTEWKTQDGRVLKPKDFETRHLFNTIRFIQRTTVYRHAMRVTAMMRFETDWGPQGDMAQLAFDQEFDAACEAEFDDLVPGVYVELFHEFETRANRDGALRPAHDQLVNEEKEWRARLHAAPLGLLIAGGKRGREESKGSGD